jgi:hypothetical protein
MNDSLLILIIWYFFIPFSVIGFGLLAQKLIIKDFVDNNFGYAGIMGIFLLILYSYASNFFVIHSKLHNTGILVLGFFSYLYFFNLDRKNIYQQSLVILIILLILFVALLIYKNHDDFPYYHFPYTYYLTQQDLAIGIGNFGHGFRTQSSIFYLNSLFYLPFVDYYLFNLGAILILCYCNAILLHNIYANLSESKFKLNDNFIRIFSLFVFSFINIFFYRIAEHGTDRSAQILVLLLFIEIAYFLNLSTLKKNNLITIYLLVGLIISLKAFYFLYFLAFIPLIFHIKKNQNNILDVFNYLIFNKIFLLFSLLLSFVLITNFFNSGCFIYPIYFTCLESMPWSIPIQEVKQMNNWYELWSKAGANPNFRVSNPGEYIQSLNWINNWIDQYFFNKVSDFLSGIIVLILTISAFFFNLDKKIFHKGVDLKIIYFIILLLLAEWFYNHPALRYGGYALIALLFFIPISQHLSKKNINLDIFFKRSIIIVIITATVFVGRNVNRINSEYKQYSYNPTKYSFYNIDSNHFRIDQRFKETLNKNRLCKNKKDFDKCLGEIEKTYIKFGKTIYMKKK